MLSTSLRGQSQYVELYQHIIIMHHKIPGCVNVRGCDPFSYMQVDDSRVTDTPCAFGNVITSLLTLLICCHGGKVDSSFVNVKIYILEIKTITITIVFLKNIFQVFCIFSSGFIHSDVLMIQGYHDKEP